MPLTRRGLRAAALFTALALALAACGGDDGGDEDAEPDTDGSSTTSTVVDAPSTTEPPVPLTPHTGEPVDEDDPLLDQPAFVVKISNNDPRSVAAVQGIEEADVVIEERIEDRATRFLVIFHSSLPERVGAVRSGRSTDLGLMAALGTPIFVYSGANNIIEQGVIRGADNGLLVRVVDDGSGVNLARDNSLPRPDNLYVDLPFLLDEFGEEAGAAEPIVGFLSPQGERPEGEPSDGITVTGRDDVAFVWVDGQGYVRVQNGEVHATRDDRPIVVDNVVVLESEYIRNPRVPEHLDAATVGSGPATVLIGGEFWEVTWTRELDGRYVLTDDDGEELLLDPGQTWISLVPSGSYELGVDAETAALAQFVQR